MQLTGPELISIITSGTTSAVAATAIAVSYLSSRNSNRNALVLAREERSSKRPDELTALKRARYAKLLSALHVLVAASLAARGTASGPAIEAAQAEAANRRKIEALGMVHDCIAELELLTDSNDLAALAGEAQQAASNIRAENPEAYAGAVSKLRASLRFDLHGHELPSIEERKAFTQILMAGTRSTAAKADSPTQRQPATALPDSPPAPETA